MVDLNKQNQDLQQFKTIIYKSISTLWTWIRVVLVGYVIVNLIIISGQVFFLIPVFLGTQTALASGTSDSLAIQSMEYVNVVLSAFNILERVRSMLGVLSSILIGVWIYRSHKNARALGVEGLTKSPAWAIGSFAVPIVSLFVPYKAMKELVLGSQKAIQQTFSRGVLLVWWWSLLLAPILATVASLMDTWIGKFLEKTVTFEGGVASLLESLRSFSFILPYMIYSLWLFTVANVLLMISAITLWKIMKAVQFAHAEIAKQHDYD